MKASMSPLLLNNFVLLNHQYELVQPKSEDDKAIESFISQYPLDIDFVFKNPEEEIVQLFVKIGVNHNGKLLPGYSLFIEGVCLFSFDKSKELTEEEKSSLLHFSGLNICINSLRNILATVTANGPLGRYILPTIDVNHLMNEKYKQTQSEK